MDVIEAIKARRSIRAYLPEQIKDEELNLILEAARLAPSASNYQPWKFIVVRDKEMKRKMAEACCSQDFVGEADTIIVGLGLRSHKFRNGYPSNAVDVTIAFEHMVLEATELGIGTCWIAAFEPGKVKKLLDIPEEIEVASVITFGYPAETPPPRERKPLSEIVCYEKYC